MDFPALFHLTYNLLCRRRHLELHSLRDRLGVGVCDRLHIITDCVGNLGLQGFRVDDLRNLSGPMVKSWLRKWRSTRGKCPGFW